MGRIGPMIVMGAALVLVLAGCTAGEHPAPTSSAAPPPSTPAVTVTVTASPTPTATPTATVTGTTTAAGCSNGITAVPPGSRTAQIGDVDGDGRPDTEFATASPSAAGSYGIRTAAGGVYRVQDGLAGPGAHGGWTAGLDASPGFVTVLGDGRQANLFVFTHCSWVRTQGVDGKPYTFGLAGFFAAGTGVACNDRNGGTLLEGVLAQKRADGRYDIRWTQIDVSSDGRTATNGATETRWSDLDASDPRVKASMESHCDDAPSVYTDGK